jgi:hypothetical protein
MLAYLSTAVIGAFLTLAAAGVHSSTTKGTIHGIVTDPSGAAIPGATVMVTDGRTLETVSTDGTGQYTLSGLVPGHYQVRIQSAGFSAYERSGLVLSAGYETEADAQLMVRTLKQAITVTAGAAD